MKLTQKQKDELTSIGNTYIATLIPMLALIVQDLDFNNFSKASLIAILLALFRSFVKAAFPLANRFLQFIWQSFLDKISK